jgi:hypothetical protein
VGDVPPAGVFGEPPKGGRDDIPESDRLRSAPPPSALPHCWRKIDMTRTASIGIRVEPQLKAAAEQAAADDHRTVASLIEKLLTEYLREHGYLKKGSK